MKLFTRNSLFGYDVFEDDCPKWIEQIHDQLMYVRQSYWWIAHRIIPSHMGHIIFTKLPKGYVDPRERLLWACMTCLEEHIQECGGPEKLEQHNEEIRATAKTDEHDMAQCLLRQANNQQEAVDIWRWWHVGRPADLQKSVDLTNLLYGKRRIFSEADPTTGLRQLSFSKFNEQEKKLFDEMSALDNKIAQDEQDYLHRLINIRESMWT